MLKFRKITFLATQIILRNLMTTAETLLKKYYGYDNFRPLQDKIIQSILDNHDTLVLMPTGGGKSLCYQIPALMKPGICIVVSPLISLMKDQVDNLINKGIPAAYLNSSMEINEKNLVINKCINKQLKLLYISPERVERVINILFQRVNINLFAIDEVHCISHWGHDFRPEYRNLSRLKSSFPNTPIVGLTATANANTQKDIINQLSLDQPKTFLASFDRPNLSIVVRQNLKPKERTSEIISYIKGRPNDSGIIYCLSKDNCDALVEKLKEQGIKAASYHSGLSAEVRQRVQDSFIKDDIQVICATIAFGMGIDKSNVRYVIHYSVPKSIEGYYQEIGRAGRDGLESDTILYFNYADLIVFRSFAEKNNQTELNLEQLNHVKKYSNGTLCRRRFLLTYFGEQTKTNCGNCDICKPDIVYQNLNQLAEYNSKNNNQIYSNETFNSLRTIRKSIADRNNVAEFLIFSNATLKDMSIKMPRTPREFLNVSGVGQVKLEKYSHEFLEYFNKLESLDKAKLESNEHKETNNTVELYSNNSNNIFNQLKPKASEIVPQTRLDKPQQKKEHSVQESLRLFNLGFSIEEIAEKREFKCGTIFKHIVTMYKNGQIDFPSQLVSLEEITKVKVLLPTLNNEGRLKPIYDAFDGSINYDKIRLILAYLEKNEI